MHHHHHHPYRYLHLQYATLIVMFRIASQIEWMWTHLNRVKKAHALILWIISHPVIDLTAIHRHTLGPET